MADWDLLSLRKHWHRQRVCFHLLFEILGFGEYLQSRLSNGLPGGRVR